MVRDCNVPNTTLICVIVAVITRLFSFIVLNIRLSRIRDYDAEAPHGHGVLYNYSSMTKSRYISDQNVLWTLFNGEAFDYIGSQRVAYDIKNGEWPATAPLTVGDIRLHVEVGQIGGSLSRLVGTWPIHAFVPYDADLPQVREFSQLKPLLS